MFPFSDSSLQQFSMCIPLNGYVPLAFCFLPHSFNLHGMSPQLFSKQKTSKNSRKMSDILCMKSNILLSAFFKGEVRKSNFQQYIFFRGGPRSVTASTPDSQAEGPGFKSQCHPTNFRPVWSPKSFPIPSLKSKNGKGFPEEGEVGAGQPWEAKKKISYFKPLRPSKAF